ncbi:MAG TPA: M1 family metallopeptidase [Nocardioides sp.]|nr:M1 family metallopeptidase [Nocardioides sp.]
MNHRAAGLVVAGVVLALLPAVPTSGVVAAAPSPGAAGIGDPYFPLDGNGGIDVRHYGIHDSYDFAERRLTGFTRLTVRATKDLSRFDLDLLLPVSSVTVDRRPARFGRPNAHELRITPARPLAAGTTFVVVVRYGGRPGRISWEGERNWLADDHEVVTMNQPHMAPWWFPANDHPRDRARMDIHITTPRGQRVVANGHLVGRAVHGQQVTTHWHAAEPMVPYLAFFAAGRFDVEHGVHDGLPWYVAVSRRIPGADRDRSMALMKRTPALVDWLEAELGVAYPFSNTGGVTTNLSPGFALETQTRPTYPVLGSGSVTTVVHELAHQWFGDSVAVENWRDIWLNEGAATFMEVRYEAWRGGETGEHWLSDWYAVLADDATFWRLPIDDPGPEHLFDWQVYQRGAMALQALRNRIGPDDFAVLLDQWLTRNRGGNGSTVKFRALAAEVSGEDLQGFFDAWLSSSTRPDPTAANGL